MKEKLLISIITVVLNGEKHIRQTIESVLNQSYKNIEYIIVDGKSTDNTCNIIKEYLPKFKNRMTFISEKDNGLYDAMNKGIELSKGDIIGIINSDDWYEFDTVEKAAKEFDKNFDGIVYGLQRDIKDEKEFGVRGSNHDFLRYSMIPHPTIFIHNTNYQKYGKFDLKYQYLADYDLMIRYYNAGVQFKKINDVLVNYREGGCSQTSRKAKYEAIKIKSKYGFISKKEKYKQYFKYIAKDIFNL